MAAAVEAETDHVALRVALGSLSNVSAAHARAAAHKDEAHVLRRSEKRGHPPALPTRQYTPQTKEKKPKYGQCTGDEYAPSDQHVKIRTALKRSMADASTPVSSFRDVTKDMKKMKLASVCHGDLVYVSNGRYVSDKVYDRLHAYLTASGVTLEELVAEAEAEPEAGAETGAEVEAEAEAGDDTLHDVDAVLSGLEGEAEEDNAFGCEEAEAEDDVLTSSAAILCWPARGVAVPGAGRGHPLTVRERYMVYNLFCSVREGILMCDVCTRQYETVAGCMGISVAAVKRIAYLGDRGHLSREAQKPGSKPGTGRYADAAKISANLQSIRSYVYKCNDETRPVSVPMIKRHLSAAGEAVSCLLISQALKNSGFKYGRGTSLRVDLRKKLPEHTAFRLNYLRKLRQYICPVTNLPLYGPVCCSDESFCNKNHTRCVCAPPPST